MGDQIVTSLFVAALVLLTLLALLALARGAPRGVAWRARAACGAVPPACGVVRGAVPRCLVSQRGFGYGRLMTTADVDPIVTGQLYDGVNRVRHIYSQRSADTGQGLLEYSSSGGVGDVGVDVGPMGLNGPWAGYDDGLPANWTIPSTPIRWHGEPMRDHYGAGGPIAYADHLFSMSEPDHDPLQN